MNLKPLLTLAWAVASAALSASAASAAPQVFTSKAQTGSMDEFFRVVVTRDCVDVKSEPWVKCSKQDIVVKDKTGKVYGKFDMSQLPKNPDGTYKINIAKIYVIDEDQGGGDGIRYFMLRFVPQDEKEIDFTPTGQMFPRYHEVVTDSGLRPVKGLRLAPGQGASRWIDAKRNESKRLVKQQRIERELVMNDYVEVMSDR